MYFILTTFEMYLFFQKLWWNISTDSSASNMFTYLLFNPQIIIVWTTDVLIQCIQNIFMEYCLRFIWFSNNFVYQPICIPIYPTSDYRNRLILHHWVVKMELTNVRDIFFRPQNSHYRTCYRSSKDKNLQSLPPRMFRAALTVESDPCILFQSLFMEHCHRFISFQQGEREFILEE